MLCCLFWNGLLAPVRDLTPGVPDYVGYVLCLRYSSSLVRLPDVGVFGHLLHLEIQNSSCWVEVLIRGAAGCLETVMQLGFVKQKQLHHDIAGMLLPVPEAAHLHPNSAAHHTAIVRKTESALLWGGSTGPPA
jgi:hypothetical protein